jgi:hypothetical protein
MKNSNVVEYVTFPSENAPEQIKALFDMYPELRDKHFVVLVSERNGPQLFKIRRVNYNGLLSTAKWCRDEESRTAEYWNNFDSGTDSRPSHYCRGLTSYIPEGSLVDLVIEVHDDKKTADQTKEVLSRYEENLCRRPPETYPSLEKLREGKYVPKPTVNAESIKDTRYGILSMLTTA